MTAVALLTFLFVTPAFAGSVLAEKPSDFAADIGNHAVSADEAAVHAEADTVSAVSEAVPEERYQYMLRVNGGESADVTTGDEIQVTVNLYRSDTQDPFSMYAVQYNLWYDSEYFEIVPDSVTIGRNRETGITVSTFTLTGDREGWLEISGNSYSRVRDGDLWDNPTEILNFRLRTRKSGTTTLVTRTGRVGTPDGMKTYPCTTNDCAITIREPETIRPSQMFSDIPDGAWYEEAVAAVVREGYFLGTGNGMFSPQSPMTRAMFVTVLSRMEGIEETAYSGTAFSDVPTGEWYSASVQWASEHGIVEGVGEGRFDPEGRVTREQMATILYRYAAYASVDVSAADASKFHAFGDKDEVSSWAVNAMIWATANGIINGTTQGTGVVIAPKDSATRAQVAQIVKNYRENVG